MSTEIASAEAAEAWRVAQKAVRQGEWQAEAVSLLRDALEADELDGSPEWGAAELEQRAARAAWAHAAHAAHAAADAAAVAVETAARAARALEHSAKAKAARKGVQRAR